MDCCRRKPKPAPQYEVSVAVQPRPPTQLMEDPSRTPSLSERTTTAAHTRFASTEEVSMVTALRTAPITLVVIDEKKVDEDLLS